MLYILTNSSTSESSTAILHDLKNEVYPLGILDCVLLYLPFLPFLPLSSKNPSGSSTEARLVARSTRCSWKRVRAYYRTRATLTNYMRLRNKTNMAEFVYR